MSSDIQFAVIIINYNAAEYLIRALKALERQRCKPRQVIILDNASQESLPADMDCLNLPIKIIHAPTNVGFAAGNNQAIQAIDPEVTWIALVNPDAYLHEDWLLEMTSAIKAHPSYAFMGSQLICDTSPAYLDGTEDVYHITGKAWRKHHKKPLHCAPQTIKPIFSPCAAAAVYRRDAFSAVQGFDEAYFCYYEDVDLAFRLWLRGFQGCYVPKAIARHTGSAVTKRHSDFYTYYGHRNIVWTYFKNMPLVPLLLTLPLHILLNLVTILLFIFRGQTKIILKAKKDAIKGLGRVLRQRQTIQANRVLSTAKLVRLLHKGLPW